MEVLVYCLFCLITFVAATSSWTTTTLNNNLGLIPEDLRHATSSLNIKKTLRHSTLPLMKKPGITNLPQIPSPILPRKLSAKRSLVKKKMKPLLKRSVLKHKLLKIPRLRKLPKLPKLPLLPILPPIIPKLPLLPLPLLPILSPLPLLPPILPSVSKLLKPLRVPIITKSRLQKALGSELIPVSIPAQNIRRRKNILQKLLNLKNRGTLTAEQFLRLKKVLL